MSEVLTAYDEAVGWNDRANCVANVLANCRARSRRVSDIF